MDFATGFLAGAAAAAITLSGALLLLARVILTSPVLLRAIESLANSWPPEVREALNAWGRIAIAASNNSPDDPEKL